MIFVYHQKEFLLLTVQSFLCGTILGAVYDVFRIARLILGMSPGAGVSFETLYKREYPLIGRISRGNEKRKKYESVILFFQDILFMLIATALLLILFFFRNDGKFRLIVILVSVLGFVCYYISIGRLVIRFSELIVFALRLSVSYLLFALLFPIRCALKCAKNIARALYLFALRIYAKRRLACDSQKYRHEILQKAGHGFIPENDKNEKDAKKLMIEKRRNKYVKDKAEKKV